MVKKSAAKKNTSKINPEIQQILVENSISLQNVLTNLSENLRNLSQQISKLLQLFEQSAKTIAEKDFETEMSNKKLMEKMDAILSQNKIIAQGVALIHEKTPSEQENPSMENYEKSITNSVQPKFNQLPK